METRRASPESRRNAATPALQNTAAVWRAVVVVEVVGADTLPPDSHPADTTTTPTSTTATRIVPMPQSLTHRLINERGADP